jgi:hypothetical protein
MLRRLRIPIGIGRVIGMMSLCLVMGAACFPIPALHAQAASTGSNAADLRVWREFTALLWADSLPEHRIAPHFEEFRAPLRGFLDSLRAGGNQAEWHPAPEQYRVGERLIFLARLTVRGHTATYSFSFVAGDGEWKFQHLEAIHIRLDTLGPLPVSHFPDLPDADKTWIREEFEVARDVQWLQALVREKGWDAALTWFADGAGYALASRVWIPFVSPGRAFVLYLCWEQARLHGADVTLVALDSMQAVVRLRPLGFLQFSRSAHLRNQISLDEFRRLFEYRWQDRATNAGWSLSISYEEDEAVLRFSR